MHVRSLSVMTALALAWTAPLGASADTASMPDPALAAADDTAALVGHAEPARHLDAAAPTRPCITIDDFKVPSTTDVTTLKAFGISCVRFDLGAANAKQIAKSQAVVRAAAADGLGILLITPYVPLGATVSHALFAADAAITAQTVALAPSAFVGVELMNEANEEAPLAETQLTPAQYVDYANTVAAALPAWMYVITSGISTANARWKEWDLQTVPYIGRANCVGAHFYGVSPAAFGVGLATIRTTFKKPACMTEWSPSSGSSLGAAFHSSAADYGTAGNHAPIFGIFNLPLLEAWRATQHG